MRHEYDRGDDYEWTQNLSQMRCEIKLLGVEECALRARSTHGVHHAIVEVNVVIGVLVVHCELLVVRVVPVVVCDDAVFRRTLVLIAFIVAFVFVVAIFQRILLYWRYSVHTSRRTSTTRSTTSSCTVIVVKLGSS